MHRLTAKHWVEPRISWTREWGKDHMSKNDRGHIRNKAHRVYKTGLDRLIETEEKIMDPV